MFCCLRRNVEVFCHKQYTLMRGGPSSLSRDQHSRDQQTPPLKCYNLYSTVEMLTTRDGPAMIDRKARYWSKSRVLTQLGFPVGILP